MKLAHCIWLVLVLVTVLYQVKAEEEKAEKKKLQIGVKKRVDPEQCKIKSRKGDTLNMHYTVSVETDENYYLIRYTAVNPLFLVIHFYHPNVLIRENLNATGTELGKNGFLYIMLNTSHWNLCGNLNGTYTVPLCHSWSRSLSLSDISSV